MSSVPTIPPIIAEAVEVRHRYQPGLVTVLLQGCDKWIGEHDVWMEMTLSFREGTPVEGFTRVVSNRAYRFKRFKITIAPMDEGEDGAER